MCTRAQRATGEQERGISPLELELEKVVSCPVGAGNQTSVLCKSSKDSQLLSHLSGPNFNRYFKIKIFFYVFLTLILKYSLQLQQSSIDIPHTSDIQL